MASGKAWNRRAAVVGGAAAGGGRATWALRGHGTIVSAYRSPMPARYGAAMARSPKPSTTRCVHRTQDDNIMGDLMVGLMTEDVGARPIPGMATTWKTSPDGLTWTFKLREAQWSDGVPVTAEDFVFSWRRLLDPATAARLRLLSLSGQERRADQRRQDAGHARWASRAVAARDAGSPAGASRALSAADADASLHPSLAAPCGDGQRQGLGAAGQSCRQRRLCPEGMGAQRPCPGGEKSALLRCRQCRAGAGHLLSHRRLRRRPAAHARGRAGHAGPDSGPAHRLDPDEHAAASASPVPIFSHRIHLRQSSAASPSTMCGCARPSTWR